MTSLMEGDVGQEHHQPVYPDPFPCRGGHAILQGSQKILINESGQIILGRALLAACLRNRSR